jgi:cellulose synthase operon protein C
MNFMRKVFLSILLVASSCATLTRLRSPTVDSDASVSAHEKYFFAKTPEELAVALNQLKQIDSNSWRFHEVASIHAQLNGQDDEAIEHLLQAASDLGNPSVLLHVNTLMAMHQTDRQRQQVAGLCAALHSSHPDSEVRAMAAFNLAIFYGDDARLKEREELINSIEGQIPLSIVGTWDNDQGKGFDSEYDPEVRRSLTDQYEGRAGNLVWRSDVPRTPLGLYDFVQVFKATASTVAYAQGQFQIEKDGIYALRLHTSDALKVFVDDALMFQSQRISRDVFGNIVIPLNLQKGTHSLFMKSCDAEGEWHISARVAPYVLAQPLEPYPHDIDLALSRLAPQTASARAKWVRAQWAHLAFGGLTTVKQAEAFENFSHSLLSKISLVDAFWFNQDRGRAADTLYALDEKFGEQVPLIRLRTLRLLLQEGRKLKARDGTKAFLEKHESREAYELMAEIWRGDGWTQNELNVWAQLKQHFEPRVQNQIDEAAAFIRMGHEEKGRDAYLRILNNHSTLSGALRPLAERYAENAMHEKAQALWKRRIDSWPTAVYSLMALASSQRQSGQFDEALETLGRAAKICQECASLDARMGDIEYERGNVNEALVHWKKSLLATPDQDELANRVDYLSPQARGPWLDDAPTENDINRLVEASKNPHAIAGADLIWLLDDEVTLLNSDGSTSNLITIVVHALNTQGRDKIIKQLVGAGRLRILHSYVVDENGKRIEAQAERDRQIFFRGMQPHSTLVLQYRIDRPRGGYLSRYFASTWRFQGPREAREKSRYVLWAPLGTQMHEARVGELASSVEQKGNQLRFEWSSKNVGPVPLEPRSPTPNELGTNIKLSTIPDWKTWLKWEEALLEGAFRDSDELLKIASNLNQGNPDTAEKLKRIHTFVMEEIRYQQDYESFIAGVKPHAAPVTLERKYGDCKDKAVLFIQLAKNLGLDAHFALVRTRDVGPVDRDVPMQQFNHAIVYVPEQDGVAARFFDPTAELLDVEAVRSDDVGTSSLVYDTKKREHTWRPIDFQNPEINQDITRIAVALTDTGEANGALTLQSQGRGGSSLRRLAKNTEGFTQFFQRAGSAFFSDSTISEATAVQVESLRQPAVVQAKLKTNSLVRKDGSNWRIKIPSDANPKVFFALQARKTPLLLGTPTQSVVELELELPVGMKVERLPQAPDVQLPCLALRRKNALNERHVSIVTTYTTLCERLSVAEYALYRAKLDDMMKLLDDELVLSLASPAANAPLKRLPKAK